MSSLPQNINILLVEDDEVDVMNVQRALKKNEINVPLHHAGNGLEALAMLRDPQRRLTQANCRLLILLDLNMPKMDGLGFLQELRQDVHLQKIPVVILTTSRQERDRTTAYQYNVAGYIVKPIGFANFVAAMNTVNQYWSISEMP